MNYQRFIGPALIFVAALAVAAVLGLPILAYLPVALVVLACPLMMVFMMKGMHGGHDETTNEHAHGGAGGDRR